MDTRFTQEVLEHAKLEETKVEEINNVVVGNFPLMQSPVPVQLTVHINNLLNTYNSKHVIPLFKDYLHNPEKMNELSSGQAIKALINHYGVYACQDWFTLIYGWDFKKAG